MRKAKVRSRFIKFYRETTVYMTIKITLTYSTSEWDTQASRTLLLSPLKNIIIPYKIL